MARKVPAPPNASGLYHARELRGMSQDELAAAAGTTKATISKLENGSRELTRLWAEKFAGPLRISAIRIVFWDKVGPLEANQYESEYAIPNPLGWTAPDRAHERTPARTSPPTAAVPRQKPLRTSVTKLYVQKWREFMGVGEIVAAKSLGLTVDDYEEIERYPFRLSGDEMGRLAGAIGIHPTQFFFQPTSKAAPPTAPTPKKRSRA